ncbi:MAG: rhodanese-like domain-containing protein [Gammaproteobacteria bacterium]|nr:rhodanese-like domain-containing protein [Gammaproteobacteria bacterium]
MNVDQMKFYQNKLAHEMDSWDVFEALGEGEAIVVVDGRTAEAFAQEHIPGAVNLPHRELSTATTAALDKSMTYVCYCDGIGCNASTKTALKLLTLGFEVRELIGGLDWWKRDGYASAASVSGVAAITTSCKIVNGSWNTGTYSSSGAK